MAIVIEGYSVVIRNATLAARYPGGVEGYRRDCPNGSFCADEHLSRLGFMVQSDADVFVAQLAAQGAEHRVAFCDHVRDGLIWAMLGATALSGAQYLWRAAHLLKSED